MKHLEGGSGSRPWPVSEQAQGRALGQAPGRLKMSRSVLGGCVLSALESYLPSALGGKPNSTLARPGTARAVACPSFAPLSSSACPNCPTCPSFLRGFSDGPSSLAFFVGHPDWPSRLADEAVWLATLTGRPSRRISAN
jgi:hypothetical protein